ncbi:MAG: hypothetical protein AAB336_02585 [Acidobacteriota bacterium]
MLKKLIVISSLIFGMFVVSSFGQETPKIEPQNTNPNPNQTRKEKRGGRGMKAKNKAMKMDVNNDGFISQSEWKRNEKAFQRLDTNNDGQLSKEEMQAARQMKGNKPNQNPNNPNPNNP